MLTFGEVRERLQAEIPELRQIPEEEFRILLRQRGLDENRELCCDDAIIAINLWFRDSYNSRAGERAAPEVAERLKRFTRDISRKSKLAIGVCETCSQGRRKRAVPASSAS